MVKHLDVLLLVLTALAVLTACGGGPSNQALLYRSTTTAASAGLATIGRLANVDVASSELMDPMFGCGAGGHIEYQASATNFSN